MLGSPSDSKPTSTSIPHHVADRHGLAIGDIARGQRPGGGWTICRARSALASSRAPVSGTPCTRTLRRDAPTATPSRRSSPRPCPAAARAAGRAHARPFGGPALRRRAAGPAARGPDSAAGDRARGDGRSPHEGPRPRRSTGRAQDPAPPRSRTDRPAPAGVPQRRRRSATPTSRRLRARPRSGARRVVHRHGICPRGQLAGAPASGRRARPGAAIRTPRSASWRRGSTRCTGPACCTATSSRRTCSSPARVGSRSSTSGSPAWPTAATRGLAGTAGYLAPELLAGAPPSPASDWFAVGRDALQEALAGPAPAGPARARPRSTASRPTCRRCVATSWPRTLSARPSGRDLLLRLGLDAPPAPSPVFVGRADELAACARALDPRRRCCCWSARAAPASRPCSPASSPTSATAAAPCVLHGRCYAGESVPYKALDGVVEALAQHLGTCSNKRCPGVHARRVIRPGARVPGADAGDRRHRRGR